MRARSLILSAAAAGIAMVLTASQQPTALAQASPGLWEIAGAPGAKSPVRQCVADVAMLARFEHRGRGCKSNIVSGSGSSTVVSYSCGSANFGRSEVSVITPRSLRIETQGISDNLPFNYVLQARRIGDCPSKAVPATH